MTEPVIKFVDQVTGDEVRYRRYSARLPEFLQKYSPELGYRVELEFTDLLSLQKGRLLLLCEAVNAGHKSSDVGPPGIEPDVNTLVCTAKLLDANDRIIRSARAAMKILDFKDFEALETAANQRLLAALGFGGDVLDEDEDRDLSRMGHTIPTDDWPPSETSADQGKDSPREQPTDAAPEASETHNVDEPVTDGERRLIENLAQRAQAEMPRLHTRDDVKAAQQQLSQLERRRRANGQSAPEPVSG